MNRQIRIFEGSWSYDVEADVNEFLTNSFISDPVLTFKVLEHTGNSPSFVSYYVMVEYTHIPKGDEKYVQVSTMYGSK